MEAQSFTPLDLRFNPPFVDAIQKQNAQDKIEELEQTGGDGDYKPE